jgi:hypothetical protein
VLLLAAVCMLPEQLVAVFDITTLYYEGVYFLHDALAPKSHLLLALNKAIVTLPTELLTNY